jgi:hypothetical protein
MISNMRFLVRAQLPTEAGNKALKSPKFFKVLKILSKSQARRLHIFLKQEETEPWHLLSALKEMT